MLGPRVIPMLLLGDDGLVKTVRFRAPRYVGDPINAVRIFNEKEVDELILLDISATPQGRGPHFDLIGKVARECFMPLCYGGGIHSLEDADRIVSLGVEKLSINTLATQAPEFIEAAAARFGSSSIVVSIDVGSGLLRRRSVWSHGGRVNTRREPVEFARDMERRGAGEILLNSIDRDGSMLGYELDLIKSVADSVSVPVVAAGGAGSTSDLFRALDAGASAAAAGSLFVFHGKHRAVLMSYPTADELRRGCRS